MAKKSTKKSPVAKKAPAPKKIETPTEKVIEAVAENNPAPEVKKEKAPASPKKRMTAKFIY